MILREDIEKKEGDTLSPYAACASQTRGRVHPEEKCRYRTDYQRDRDRIVHSKSFRRLMHKTQVFLAPEGDHFRTRLTHTWAIPPSAIMGRISWRRSIPAASVTMCRAFGWWKCWKEIKTTRG